MIQFLNFINEDANFHCFLKCYYFVLCSYRDASGTNVVGNYRKGYSSKKKYYINED